MLGEEGKDHFADSWRTYSRSVSWTERSPTNISQNRWPPTNSKPRPLLPPLTIVKQNAKEWPHVGSDDLGIWPLPQTLRSSVRALESSDSGHRSSDNRSDMVKDSSIDIIDLSLPPNSDSFSSYPRNSLKFNSKFPTLSPSSSDYASSITFSPSSTNWSDLSLVSSRQPSPSSMEPSDSYYAKDLSFSENSLLLKAASSPKEEPFCADHTIGGANTCMPSKGCSPSLAERRGNNPPPRMFLPSVNESSHDHTTSNLLRSQSFCLPDLDGNVMEEDVSLERSDNGNNGEGQGPIEDADISSGGESQSENNDSDHNMRLCYVI